MVWDVWATLTEPQVHLSSTLILNSSLIQLIDLFPVLINQTSKQLHLSM